MTSSEEQQEPQRQAGSSLAELRALARHAAHRVALYRRKRYAGGGTPRRLAELERIAKGSADRLRRREGSP